MFKWAQRLLIPITVGVLLIGSISPMVVKADITSCSALTTAHTVYEGSNTDFQFRVSNTDTNPINWIRITRPSSNFSIVSGTMSSWTANTLSSSVTFTGGTIDPGNNNEQIYVNATATAAAPSANWLVQVSDTGDESTFDCTGSLDTEITQASGPNIFNVSVSEISSTSVRIRWDTDVESSSKVNYGLDSGYGNSSNLDSALVTEHSVRLVGLSSNTSYHYQVVSVNSNSGTTESSDNTFLTAIQESNNQNSSASIPLNTPIAIKDKPTESQPPTVVITAPEAKVFKTAPTLSGTAADNEALAGLEYSTDGGKNWLPVNSYEGLGTKTATFSFTPVNLEDGNYDMVARAIDTSGNIGKSSISPIVIDRLPPTVGGNVYSVGPHVLSPDDSNTIYTSTKIDQKITLSAVGGPTSISLAAVLSGKTQSNQSVFNLTQSEDTGLWSGIISFSTPGEYNLLAKSIDGANNNTSRQFSTVKVLEPSKVQDNKGTAKPYARVTIKYQEPTTGAWVAWDSKSYGQDNPITASETGEFNLLLPPGRYYLEVGAKDSQTTYSDIFSLKTSTALSSTFRLKKSLGFSLGPLHLYWPNFSSQKISINESIKATNKTKNNDYLVGKTLPNFELSDTSGNRTKSISWLGRPTVITITSTWSPSTITQLPELAKLQTNKNINIVVIGEQESAGKLQSVSEIAGYQITWMADPDGIIVDKFNLNSIPTHYFVDRRGIVKEIVTGVLSKQDILNNLAL